MTEVSLRLEVAPEIAEAYPRVRISALLATGVDTRRDAPDVDAYVAEAVAHAAGEAPVAAAEVARWRRVYRDMGVDPTKMRSSLDALHRRAAKGSLPRINPVVDACNAVTVRHALCLGTYDAATIEGDLAVRHARDGETLVPIGASSELELTPRAVVYADAARVLCGWWNHRDADATKVSDDTTDVLVVVDEVEGEPGRADAALSDVEALLGALGGVAVARAHVDAQTRSATLGRGTSPA